MDFEGLSSLWTQQRLHYCVDKFDEGPGKNAPNRVTKVLPNHTCLKQLPIASVADSSEPSIKAGTGSRELDKPI